VIEVPGPVHPEQQAVQEVAQQVEQQAGQQAAQQVMQQAGQQAAQQVMQQAAEQQEFPHPEYHCLYPASRSERNQVPGTWYLQLVFAGE